MCVRAPASCDFWYFRGGKKRSLGDTYSEIFRALSALRRGEYCTSVLVIVCDRRILTVGWSVAVCWLALPDGHTGCPVYLKLKKLRSKNLRKYLVQLI